MKKLLFTFFILLAPTLASAATIGKVQSNNIGLVGWWTFDGTDMNPNVRDMSGTGNSGFLVGYAATTTMTGKVGQALQFSGNEQAMRVADSASIQTINTSKKFTASMWIYRKGDNPVSLGNPIDTLLYKGPWGGNNDNATAFGIYSSFQNSPVGLQIGTSRYIANTTLQNNIWYHVVATIDGASDTYTLYINGAVDKTGTTFSDLSLDANPILLADVSDRSYDFNGIIDDVRIYNRALTGVEVRTLFNSGKAMVAQSPTGTSTPLSQGLVGYWTFDGPDVTWTSPTAGTVKDKTGISSAGTFTRMTMTSSIAAGKFGQALFFDAANSPEIPVVTSAADLGLLTTTTIAVWVKPRNVSDGQERTIFAPNFDQNWWVELVGSTASWHGLSGAGSTFNGGTLQSGEWSFLTFVGSSISAKIYVNGTLVSSATDRGPGALPGSPQTFIGSTKSRNFNGTMDDLRVYNRELSAQEISQLYNLGQSKIAQSPDVGSTTVPVGSGLLGYWTLDGSKTNWATGKTLDSSGQGNTATLVNLSTSTSLTIGKVGQAMVFNGVNSYASTTVTNYFSTVDKNNSFFAWVYPTRSSANITSITQIGETADGNFATGLGISGGVLVRNEDGDQSPMPSSGLSVPLNQWSFVGYVHYQASNLTDFYVNDTTVTVSDTENRPISPNPVLIGAGAHNGVLGSFFSGKIDDVRLYGRTLTPAEVQKLYLMGR